MSSSDTPTLDYQAAADRRRERWDWRVLMLCAVTAYFGVSSVTLPFLDSLWMDEIPLLALVQLPKVAVAGWLRTGVVMPAIRWMGLSSGSFSPDYLTARPYALALAYLLILGLVFFIVWVGRRRIGSARRWRWIALIAAVIDFGMTLWFAAGPGLSVY